MPRFHFPLDPLLEHRRHIERDRQVIVSKAERERAAIEAEIRSYQASIQDCKTHLHSAMTTSSTQGRILINPAHLRMQAGAALGLRVKAQQAVLRLAGAHQRLDVARAHLLEATKARRAVEALKERRYREWLTEQRRREHRETDELATQRAARPHAEISSILSTFAAPVPITPLNDSGGGYGHKGGEE